MYRDMDWLIGNVVVDDSTACWIWQGRKSIHGYGLSGKAIIVHRLAWELRNGRPPGDLLVCHTCDNPPCCNPDHLWLGTHAENMADCKAKGRSHLGDANGMRKHPDKRPAGEFHGKAKLTLHQVEDIRKKGLEGCPRRCLAEENGVTTQAIGMILRGKNWVARKAPLSKIAVP